MIKRILCGAVAEVCWMTHVTANNLKQIVIETGHNETAQERHSVEVDGCMYDDLSLVSAKFGGFYPVAVVSISYESGRIVP